MTTAQGTLTSCGPGQSFSLQFTCTGPSCSALNGFPGTTCTADGDVLQCTNNQVCPGSTNYTSDFSFSQADVIVSQTQHITLSDFCEDITVVSDGTTGGTNTTGVSTGDCGPDNSNSTSSSSSSTSSSSISLTSSGLSSNTVSTSSTPISTVSTGSIQTSTVGTGSTSKSTVGTGSTPTSTSGPSSGIPSISPGLNSTYTWSAQPTKTSSTDLPPFTSGARPIGQLTTSTLWCAIFVFLGFLVQATSASALNVEPCATPLVTVERSLPIRNTEANLTQIVQRAITPGWKTFLDDFSEFLAGKIAKPEFADNLAEELASAVCDHAVGVVINKALGVDLVEACVEAVYAGNLILAPEFEFLAVFYASVGCNLLVSTALPGIGELTDQICEEKKPCSKDLLTDPNNCGTCGNVCPTGSCANGACTSSSCTGQVCSNFGPCGPGGTCVCASTTELTGYCVDGSTPCDGLADCSDSTDCASGEICGVGSCCQRNVCVGATFCGGGSGASDALSLMARAAGLGKRTWENSTIASLGLWVA